MRPFTGQYERTIDSKNRIQIPSQIRAAIDAERDGAGLYVSLGERPGSLWLLTERGFEALAERMATETMADERSGPFERQFYSSTQFIDIDKQGRVVLPERLVRKARLGAEVTILGCKSRFEVWAREAFEKTYSIDWEGDQWPDWSAFLRMSGPGATVGKA